MNPTHEELRTWCHGEMRAASDTAIHRRAVAILKLLDVATMPPWLADAAEALGEVRPEDGAPLALNWTQVIAAIHELREQIAAWFDRNQSEDMKNICLLCASRAAADIRARKDEAK